MLCVQMSHFFCLVEEDGVLGVSFPRKEMACASVDVAERIAEPLLY